MKMQFSIPLISSLLLGCLGNKSTFNENERIGKLGTAIKIEYYKNIPGEAFTYSDTAIFIIKEKHELKSVIDEIKNADNPEPWKGAGWDNIRIHYPDTILNLYTNKRKIGLGASGQFYDLKKENFITKRMNEK